MAETAWEDGDTVDAATLNALGADVNTKYELPAGGVPKSDFTAAVQTSLDLADTAYQAPDVVAAGADAAAARMAIGGARVVTEHYDVQERQGAACDGSTDDTAAWAAAVTAVSSGGGGLIWWRGTSVVSQIELVSEVGLDTFGRGAGVLKQKAGRAAGQHLILLDAANAQNVVLRNFAINGDRTNQTGEADGIHLDNTAGTSANLARHLIQNVTVREVLGDGVHWGPFMRSSLIDNLVIYSCDGYGFYGETFSDNTMINVDVGQSGEHGVYLVGCHHNQLSNIRSWYSGRLVAGSVGVYQRNGSVNVYSNISTQENSGTGMQFFGAESEITGCIVRGLNSDSDNTQATTGNHGLSLNNVHHSIFDVAVTSEAALGGIPQAGVSVVASSGNKIFATVDPAAVTWPLMGGTIGDNDIDLCRGTTASTPIAAFAPAVYQYREHRVTLTDNRTVNNPSTSSGNPPTGLKFRFVFIQDATGGRTLTWSSAYKIPSGVSFDTTASTRTVVEFECVTTGDWIMTDFTTGIPA